MCYQHVKKTKFVDAFTRIVCLPHVFDHGQTRKLLVFCKNPEMEDIARDAGADYVGGKQLIKQIQVRYYFLQHIAYALVICTISYNKLQRLLFNN